MNFESFHLHSRIESGIKTLRYTVPTSIQIQCIPTILKGRDIIGLAQTGTGKTAGFAATSLQGDLTQQKREKALNGFRKGAYRVLVATDIAARGIDVTRISHVINFDAPDTVDAYTHRIGRTGRASKSGDAFTFMTPKDRSLVGDIENILGEKMERRMLEGFDYSVPASLC